MRTTSEMREIQEQLINEYKLIVVLTSKIKRYENNGSDTANIVNELKDATIVVTILTKQLQSLTSRH